MDVRFATPEDFTAINAIERQAHFHPWPEDVLKRYLHKPKSSWVIHRNEEILGYAINTLIAGEAELLMIAVKPDMQGQGIGRQLLEEIQHYLSAAKAEQWFLEVRASNHKAIQLYESLGFIEAGVRKNYYPSAKGHEDALLFCLALD